MTAPANEDAAYCQEFSPSQAEQIRNLKAEIEKLIGSVVDLKKEIAELKEMSNIEGEVTDAATH